MNARENLGLFAMVGKVDTVRNRALTAEKIDAHRAEVLGEAADFVGNDDECGCGGCDTCIPRKLAEGLRRMAEGQAVREAAAPDFFQRGHTYRRASHGQFLYFQVDHVSTPPNGRDRTAFGWLQAERGGTAWHPRDESNLGDWTDITDTTQGDRK